MSINNDLKNPRIKIFGRQKLKVEWKVVGFTVNAIEIDGKRKANYTGTFENRKGKRVLSEVSPGTFETVQTLYHNTELNDEYPLRLDNLKVAKVFKDEKDN